MFLILFSCLTFFFGLDYERFSKLFKDNDNYRINNYCN
ncbi:hypothetical protein ACVNPX_08925 [Staphylococcus aureus]